MKISKLLPVVCALTLGANGLTVRADDTPAQAAARRALAQKLSEWSEPPPQAVTAKPKAAPAAQRTEATKAGADQAAATVSTGPEDASQMSAQRAAQMAALTAAMGEKPAAETPAKKEAPAKPAKMVSEARPAAQPVVAVVPQPPTEANVNYAGKNLGLKPIAAPALPISASKEDQLEGLLMRYKANLISPEEYHQQRAAILAAP